MDKTTDTKRLAEAIHALAVTMTEIMEQRLKTASGVERDFHREVSDDVRSVVHIVQGLVVV